MILIYVQVQLFSSTKMNFTNNSAERLGGVFGIDNVRVEEDLSPILNYNCFMQYNVGEEDEHCPSTWKVNLVLRVNVWLSSLYNFRLNLYLIITKHPKGIYCMLKILVDVHQLLVILTNQLTLFMKVHCLAFQMFLSIHTVTPPGM